MRFAIESQPGALFRPDPHFFLRLRRARGWVFSPSACGGLRFGVGEVCVVRRCFACHMIQPTACSLSLPGPLVPCARQRGVMKGGWPGLGWPCFGLAFGALPFLFVVVVVVGGAVWPWGCLCGPGWGVPGCPLWGGVTGALLSQSEGFIRVFKI